MKPLIVRMLQTGAFRLPTLLAVSALALTFVFGIHAQPTITVNRKVVSGGSIFANTLVAESGASGTVTTATGNDFTGVATSNGVSLGPVPVAISGTANVYVNTASPVVGDLAICNMQASGYAVDSGATTVASLTIGVEVVGRILQNLSLPGTSPALVTVQLFGPGAGSNWQPLVNGFFQAPTSYYTSGSALDNYTYKMCAPTSSTPTGTFPYVCPTTNTFIPSGFPAIPALTSSYSGFWIDRGGFGSAGNGTTGVAPNDYELFRLSAVTQPGVRENTLEIFNFSTRGLGSVPASFFNEAGVTTNSFDMYGLNTHVSGCDSTKCGQMPAAHQTDHDIRLVGIESDIEERAGPSKTSGSSLGFYSACVNCNNSGSAAVPNIAFLAGQATALPGSGGFPWGVGFETASAGALIGLYLNPLAASGPADSQPIQECAYIGTGITTPTCEQLSTTSAVSANVSPSSAVHSQFVNPSTGSLGPVSFGYNQNTYTVISPAFYTMTASDLGAYWNDAGAAMPGVTFILPPPTTGSVVYFTELAAAGFITVKPTALGRLCLAGKTPLCTPAGTGALVSTAVGSFLKLYAVSSTQWFVEYEFPAGNWNGP